MRFLQTKKKRRYRCPVCGCKYDRTWEAVACLALHRVIVCEVCGRPLAAAYYSMACENAACSAFMRTQDVVGLGASLPDDVVIPAVLVGGV